MLRTAEAKQCKALFSKGSVSYYGVTFWHGKVLRRRVLFCDGSVMYCPVSCGVGKVDRSDSMLWQGNAK